VRRAFPAFVLTAALVSVVACVRPLPSAPEEDFDAAAQGPDAGGSTTGAAGQATNASGGGGHAAASVAAGVKTTTRLPASTVMLPSTGLPFVVLKAKLDPVMLDGATGLLNVTVTGVVAIMFWAFAAGEIDSTCNGTVATDMFTVATVS